MAQYSVKLYAVDSWTEDMDGTIARADRLTAITSYQFRTVSGTAEFPLSARKGIYIKWTIPDAYAKKREVSGILYAYVTAKETTGGALPANSRFLYKYGGGSSWGSMFYAGQGIYWDEVNGLPMRTLSINAFNPINSYYDDGGRIFTACGAYGGLYNNENYHVSASLTIHSHSGANKPYLDAIFGDIIPYVSEQYPQSGFINEKAETEFGWKTRFGETASGSALIQQRAEFRWRTKGSTAYQTIALQGSATKLMVPANTFTGNEIEWQIQVQSDDGIWSAAETWFPLSTVDSISTAAADSPNNAFMNGDAAHTFRWSHCIQTGTLPSKSELQYSVDGVTWTALSTVEGAATECVIPAGTLLSGKMQWQVRTFNTDGIAGEWSKAAIVMVHAHAVKPVISEISNAARPGIRWQAVGQISYEIRITQEERELYATGEVPSTEKRTQILDYLEDGAYTTFLRIKNQEQQWSEWGYAGFTVKTKKPILPVARVVEVPFGIRIETEPVSGKNLLTHSVELPCAGNGITVDYDTKTGEYIFNGTIQSGQTPLMLALRPFQWSGGQLYSLSIRKTGGTVQMVGAKNLALTAEAYQNGAPLSTRFFVNAQLADGATEGTQAETSPVNLAENAGQMAVFLDSQLCGGNRFINFRVKLQLEKGAVSEWESFGKMPVKRYLLRNGQPVAMMDAQYTDYSALGDCAYVVRAVSDDDRFADSRPVFARSLVSCGSLAAAEKPSEMILFRVRRSEPVTGEGELSFAGELHKMAGRSDPIYEFSEFIGESRSLKFTLTVPEDWNRLRTLLERRGAVLYRDQFGTRYYGVIAALSFEQQKCGTHQMTDFSLTITRTAYLEKIRYDPPEGL